VLFIITNLAIVLVLGIVLSLLGVDRILDEQGVGLDLYNLLIFAAVFGFGGSLISLAISKWTAKRLTGAQVITSPANEVPKPGWSDRSAAGRAGRHRHARGGDLRRPGCQRLCHRHAAQQRPGGGEQRTAAVHEPEEAEAVLAHEVSHVANGDMITLALIQGVVNTFVIVHVARGGAPGRPGRVQDRARPRPGLLHHLDHRPAGLRHPRQHHRDVVQPPAGIPCRCRQREPWRAARR
jgi:heat shock protein HtpX